MSKLSHPPHIIREGGRLRLALPYHGQLHINHVLPTNRVRIFLTQCNSGVCGEHTTQQLTREVEIVSSWLKLCPLVLLLACCTRRVFVQSEPVVEATIQEVVIFMQDWEISPRRDSQWFSCLGVAVWRRRRCFQQQVWILRH